jgi:hypothetical protein
MPSSAIAATAAGLIWSVGAAVPAERTSMRSQARWVSSAVGIQRGAQPLLRLAVGAGQFVEFAVQGRDGAVPFTDGGFQFGDLGVFGGQPGP